MTVLTRPGGVIVEPPPFPEEMRAELLTADDQPQVVVLKAEPTCKVCYTQLPDDQVRVRDCPICGCRAAGQPPPWSR